MFKDKGEMIDFDKYVQSLNGAEKLEKARMWQAAIGLQGVDGLKVSEYLIQVAIRHIEGDITIEQVRSLIDSYYDKREHESGQNR